MTFLDRLNSPKCDFTQNQSGSKIIKDQQSQALTSHFESFWSIVHKKTIFCPYLEQLGPIYKQTLQSANCLHKESEPYSEVRKKARALFQIPPNSPYKCSLEFDYSVGLNFEN